MADIWHQRLGYLRLDALTYLLIAIVETKLKGLAIIEYKIYTITKAYKIISR